MALHIQYIGSRPSWACELKFQSVESILLDSDQLHAECMYAFFVQLTIPKLPFMKNEQKAPRITRGASLYSTSILLMRQRSNTSSLLSSHRSPACQFANSASGAASSHRCNSTRSDTLKLPSAFTSPVT